MMDLSKYSSGFGVTMLGRMLAGRQAWSRRSQERLVSFVIPLRTFGITLLKICEYAHIHMR